jgi:AcrR family transcriptional regulator
MLVKRSVNRYVHRMSEEGGSRSYRKTARAEHEAATRRRIVDATVQLHREVGPARTTISAIAERAGVQRLTVYRHFPHDADLLQACGEAFIHNDPPPDPTPWAAIEDTRRRVATGLGELYAWYRGNADMLANTARDAPLIPALAATADSSAYQDAIAKVLLGPARAAWTTRSALGLALEFTTWHTLTTRQALSDARAAALMTQLVLDTTRHTPRTRQRSGTDDHT